MSNIGSTPRTLTSDSATSNLPRSVNVQEQNSLTSDLTTTGTASTATLTSLQSESEDQSTNVPIGAFHLTLQNAGLGDLALQLGHNLLNLVEGSVHNAALTALTFTGGNAHALSEYMGATVQYIKHQANVLLNVNAGSNNDSSVVIEEEIIEMAINEAIVRLQNSN
jgi:hypothetical protein